MVIQQDFYIFSNYTVIDWFRRIWQKLLNSVGISGLRHKLEELSFLANFAEIGGSGVASFEDGKYFLSNVIFSLRNGV